MFCLNLQLSISILSRSVSRDKAFYCDFYDCVQKKAVGLARPYPCTNFILAEGLEQQNKEMFTGRRAELCQSLKSAFDFTQSLILLF